MSPRHLNFHRPSSRLRLLQVATLVAVLGAASAGTVLFSGSGTRYFSANISDTLASPSFSEVPEASVPVSPAALSEHPITGAAPGLHPDTVRYYEKQTGKAFSVELATRRTDTLSDVRLPGFISSLWIPKSASVISSFQKNGGTEYRYYDYADGSSAVLGSDVSSVATSPDGRTVAVIRSVSADTLRISVSAPDGTDPKDLLTTRISEPSVRWRTSDEVSIISQRPDRAGKDLSLLSTDGTLRQLLTNKENLDASWSPDGRYLLYSFFSGDAGISLWLMDVISGDEVSLDIPTSASKCAWYPTGLAIVCGIPTQNSLARDVPVDFTASIDSVVVYDFDANNYRMIYQGMPGSLYGVTEPFVSSSGSTFVFTNMFDARLYALPLE